MITHIKINGFKSFHNFEMMFTPFTVIAGINASGKSNLFDALELLSAIASGKKTLKEIFRDQRGDFIELFTKYDEQHYVSQMTFEVDMLVDKNITDAWGASAKLKYTRLQYSLTIQRVTGEYGIDDLIVTNERLETIKHDDDQWIKLISAQDRGNWRPKVTTGKRGTPYIYTENNKGQLTAYVPQDGVAGGKKRTYPLINATQTILSSIGTIDFRHILAAKNEMENWRFLRFNPEHLRQPTSKYTGADKLTPSGLNLAAVLYRIKQEDEYSLIEISRELNRFIPEFTGVDVIDDVEHNQYVIYLQQRDGKIFSSRVLSEGTLRLLALCIIEYDNKVKGIICYEEPENGIHPFRINAMAHLLYNISTDFSDQHAPLRQVIINTHSPVVVKDIFAWEHNDHVSIYYSQMRSRTTNIDQSRVRINITRMIPVVKELDNIKSDTTGQLEWKYNIYSNEELKATLSTVESLLNMSNTTIEEE